MAGELSPAEAQQAVKELARLPGNSICADCHAPSPTWASINLGVFICLDCSAHHRAMGTHISKVKSLTLDKWNAEMVNGMRRAGNLKANAYWEKGLPPGFPRPTTADARGLFIRQKYEQRKFLQELPPASSQQGAKPSQQQPTPQPVVVQPPSQPSAQTDAEKVRRRRAPPGSTPAAATSIASSSGVPQPAASTVSQREPASIISDDLLSLDVSSSATSTNGNHILLGFDSSVTSSSPAMQSSFSFLGGGSAMPAQEPNPKPAVAASSSKMSLSSFESTLMKPQVSPLPLATTQPLMMNAGSSAPTALAQIDGELDAISAKLRLASIAADQLESKQQPSPTSNKSTAVVGQVKAVLGATGMIQVVNEKALELLLSSPAQTKSVIDSLRKAASLLEDASSSAKPISTTADGNVASQLIKLKDDLVNECSKLDTLQMKRLDGLVLGPNPPPQLLEQRRLTSAKAASLVSEANALRERVLRVVGSSSSSAFGPTGGGGFAFMQTSSNAPTPPVKAPPPNIIPSFLE